MPTSLIELLAEQRSTGFADFAGATASLRLPIADTLLTRIIRERIPASAPVRDVEIHALAGDQFTVKVKLTKPSFLPPLKLHLHIERQPALPGSPVLALRLDSAGVGGLAGAAMGQMKLPPGITMDGGLLLVDLRALASAHGFTEELGFLTTLRVTTDRGRVVLHADMARPQDRAASVRT